VPAHWFQFLGDALEHSEDVSAADWLSESAASPERLVRFGPATFPAYARLRYLPDPVRAGMTEADALVPFDHPADVVAARAALTALARYSRSTDSCYICLWEGYGGMLRVPELVRGPLVTLPHRRYVLFTATLDELEHWTNLFDSTFNSPPAFVWPADHRWCFASDVDPHWAGIGADRDAIDQLVADPSVDVVPADPDEEQPTYY
jgi:hypothetical protein